MSTFDTTHTCAACGAEESLDSLLHRMIDDDLARRLIADIIGISLPLGGQVVSYLRLHKPLKQQLRLTKVQAVLGELAPDLTRGRISRKGRDWHVTPDLWRAAFAEVFKERDKGSLRLPLEGNGYLYQVVMRLADQAEAAVEAAAERDREQAHRARPRSTEATGLNAALASYERGELTSQRQAEPSKVLVKPQTSATGTVSPGTVSPDNSGPSAAAKRIKAEIAAKLALRSSATSSTPAAEEPRHE
jgi:hypothetical protein